MLKNFFIFFYNLFLKKILDTRINIMYIYIKYKFQIKSYFLLKYLNNECSDNVSFKFHL